MQRRTLCPEIRIADATKGLVEYIASDETLDSYGEVIRAKGWRFTHFAKNAPFVDSHNYGCIDRLLGNVVEFAVEKNQLVERVQWAINAALPENHLAMIGWKLTEAGMLKAVSVGFRPTKMVSKWDRDLSGYRQTLQELGLDETRCAAVYLEQEQLELSACILGANPAALAKAWKAGVIGDAAIERISMEIGRQETASDATKAVAASLARQQRRGEFLEKLERAKRTL
jgi:hypothetical protein